MSKKGYENAASGQVESKLTYRLCKVHLVVCGPSHVVLTHPIVYDDYSDHAMHLSNDAQGGHHALLLSVGADVLLVFYWCQFQYPYVLLLST